MYFLFLGYLVWVMIKIGMGTELIGVNEIFFLIFRLYIVEISFIFGFFN